MGRQTHIYVKEDRNTVWTLLEMGKGLIKMQCTTLSTEFVQEYFIAL